MKRSRSIPVVLLVLIALAGCDTTATAPEEMAAPKKRRPADESGPGPAEAGAKTPAPPAEPSFRYDPGGRRDPFVSPFEAIEAERGPRPSGIAGMSVDDLDLTGIVAIPGGKDVAYVTGSDGKGYMLHVSDRVYSATVLAIDAGTGAITFREQVDDPRSIKPYRDRVLRLGSGAD